MRAKVEHVFGVIKRVFGFAKVRYRGLEKNAHRLFVTCALVISSWSGNACSSLKGRRVPVERKRATNGPSNPEKPLKISLFSTFTRK